MKQSQLQICFGRLNAYAYTKIIDIDLIEHIMTFTQSYPVCVTKDDGNRKDKNNKTS